MPLGTEVGLGPGDIVLDGDPALPEKGTAPNFRPVFVVAKWLDTVVDLGPGHIVLDGGPSSRERGTAAHPLFLARVYCGHGRPSHLLLSSC